MEKPDVSLINEKSSYVRESYKSKVCALKIIWWSEAHESSQLYKLEYDRDSQFLLVFLCEISHRIHKSDPLTRITLLPQKWYYFIF